MAGRRKKVSLAGIVIGIGMLIIFCAAATILGSRIKELRQKDREAIQRVEQLEKEYDEEQERGEKLKEQKKRVKTDEYIKEVARDRLGLIDPGEVLFKEEGK